MYAENVVNLVYIMRKCSFKLLQKVPYRTIYTDATEKEWKLQKKDTERTLNVLQLRDANIEPGQLWDKCEDIPDDQADDEEEGEGMRTDIPALSFTMQLV